jgi:hypothetical protein
MKRKSVFRISTMATPVMIVCSLPVQFTSRGFLSLVGRRRR